MEQIILNHYTEDDIGNIIFGMNKILERNKLAKNIDILIAAVLILGDYYTVECDFIRLHNQESSNRMENFITGVNEIFKREERHLSIKFKEKGSPQERKSSNKMAYKKPWEFEFKDKPITDWIIKTLRVALVEGRVPINIGTQLWKMNFVKDELTQVYKYNLRDIVPGTYEDVRPDVIIADTICKISVEFLNVLNQYTHLKYDNGKWTTPQLVVVIEVLILLNFYNSSNSTFEIGRSKPTLDDKKYLRRLLERKKKQGLITLRGETQTLHS